MKIAIGMRLQDGPFGGGNQFGRALSQHLSDLGWGVHFDLSPRDLDLILLTEPRSNMRISAFTDFDVLRYIKRINDRTITVHRVNECDERKGTNSVNRRLLLTSECVDHTVFISSWLRDLFVGHGWKCPSRSVILNGAASSTFNSAGQKPWDHQSKLKIVTHHWGGNFLKGFDVYSKLDSLIGTTDLGDKVSFTYVGNIPSEFTLPHTVHIPPLSGKDLADEIRKHHVYLTASQNEPAGMHHIEGAMCGLPLLYRRSGALPEYCDGFGIAFGGDDFEQRLHEMFQNFDAHAAKITEYPHSADKMCREYSDLFKILVSTRDNIVSNRHPPSLLRHRLRARFAR